jgi:hypothetical protein
LRIIRICGSFAARSQRLLLGSGSGARADIGDKIRERLGAARVGNDDLETRDDQTAEGLGAGSGANKTDFHCLYCHTNQVIAENISLRPVDW